MKISSGAVLAIALTGGGAGVVCDAYSVPTRSTLRSLGRTKSVVTGGASSSSRHTTPSSSSIKMEGTFMR